MFDSIVPDERRLPWCYRLSDQIDQWLAGRRAGFLGLFAFASIGIQIFGDRAERDSYGSEASVIFVLGLTVLLFLFVAGCRNEETNKLSLSAVMDRLGGGFDAVTEVFADLQKAPWSIRFQHIGRFVAVAWLLAAQTVLLAVRYSVIDSGASEIILLLWGSTLGLVMLFYGRHLEKHQGQDIPPSRSNRQIPMASEAVHQMAVTVHTGHTMQATNNPLVDALLGVLASWRPGRQRNERAYHDRLFHALRRNLSTVHVESEKRIEERRVDLVLGGQNEMVLVEIKAHLKSATECDRAYGQLTRYTKYEKGPVLLVLCKTSHEDANVQRLISNIASVRSQKFPMAVVFASVDREIPVAKLLGASALESLEERAQHARPVSVGVPLCSLAVASLPFMMWLSNPPRTLQARAIREARTPNISMRSLAMPNLFSGTTCTAVTSTGFHLRPRATLESIGPRRPSGTQLTVLEFAGMTRSGGQRLFRVQMPDGTSGYAFLSPNEFVGTCGL